MSSDVSLHLSSDCHALLCELQLQRAASTRYLQDTLYARARRALLDTLDPVAAVGLVRQRTEQQWSLTAEGTLTLILAVRAGAAPCRSGPGSPRSRAWSGHRRWCASSVWGGGADPGLLPECRAPEPPGSPRCPRLLAGSQPAWQALLLEHFALQALLDAEPDEGWPLATLVASCSPALSGSQIQARAREWEWLCGSAGAR